MKHLLHKLTGLGYGEIDFLEETAKNFEVNIGELDLPDLTIEPWYSLDIFDSILETIYRKALSDTGSDLSEVKYHYNLVASRLDYKGTTIYTKQDLINANTSPEDRLFFLNLVSKADIEDDVKLEAIIALLTLPIKASHDGSLMGAFVWADTPQGHKFWSKILSW